jgi:tetratricopeptide (TPR) repeat protein
MNSPTIRSTSMATLGLLMLLVLGTQYRRAPAAPSVSQQPGGPREASAAERDRLNSEAITLRAEGKHAEAIALYLTKLALERAVLGDGDDAVVATLRRLAELYAYRDDFGNARTRAQEALDIQRNLPDAKPWQIAEARRTLTLVDELSRMDGSRRRKVVGIDRLHDRMLRLYVDGKFQDGIKLAQQIEEMSQHALGDGHPDLAAALNNLGVFHHSQGQYGRAEPLYRKALEIFKAALGEEHPDYVTTFNNLAVVYAQQGDYEKAFPLYRRALSLRTAVVGEKHPDYVRSVNNLAWLHKATGDLANSETLYLKALHLQEQGLNYGWPDGRVLEIFRHVDVRQPSLAAKKESDLALIVGNLAVCYQ